jgi:squalene-hopene/tetraprenyl-beta-curcumene cyclase
MKYLFATGLGILTVLGFLLAVGPQAPAQTKKNGADSKTWQATVDKAVAYLRGAQDKNGGWGTERSPGITGIVLTGLLKTGAVSTDDPMAAKALGYIESLVNVKAGHIAGKAPKVQLQNYVTCVNVMALVAAKRADKYEKIIGNAVKFLKQLQWDEGEGKSKDDPFYGGAGYDSQSRPDLSNTQMFMDALKEAGVPANDPAIQKALIFVSRCQNLKSEDNSEPWAGRINDGSFIYTPANGGVTKVIDNPGPNDPRPGYGSMTYAGVKSMIYCGVDKTDKRVKAALDWLRKHYTVDENPGMPGVRKEWGLYYYYHTMAKSLDALGVDEFVDAKGQAHNWRADITSALAKRQDADGFWRGNPHWLESDPDLDTGYALMALSYCKPRAK